MFKVDKEKTKLTRKVLIEKFEFMGIGAYVKVEYPGERYLSNRQFKEMKFKNSEEQGQFSNKFFEKKEFIIFAKSSFYCCFERREISLCGIEDEEGNQFLFDQNGLSY